MVLFLHILHKNAFRACTNRYLLLTAQALAGLVRTCSEHVLETLSYTGMQSNIAHEER